MRLMKISDPRYSARRFAGVMTAVLSNPTPTRQRFPMPRGLRAGPMLLLLACALSTASFQCRAQDASGSPKYTVDVDRKSVV